MTNSPIKAGDRIHRARDDEGNVDVYEHGTRRYLTFGNGIEQSCMDIEQPQRLVYVYTQAMMLSLLLHRQPCHASLLGLGGGSLARALRIARPNMMIDVVEYRAAVIKVACDFFSVNEDDCLSIHAEDANTFIKHATHTIDIVFADMYIADGIHEAQVSPDFLETCRSRLSENGIFVANHWCSEFKTTEKARQVISEAFDGKLLHLHVQGGNVIVFAFNGKLPTLERKSFFEQAQSLALALNIPLQPLARNFWCQNCEALQLDRFKYPSRR